jgi:DNA modification methylase
MRHIKVPDLINSFLLGDALTELSKLQSRSVDMCVTSPPYYKQRDYGFNTQIGLEDTPEVYIEKLVLIFNEVNRVLKPHGTLWLNIGDTYAGKYTGINDYIAAKDSDQDPKFKKHIITKNLKPKDLIGIPWLLALALRNSGWYLRCDIIWSKRNPMPESIKDRPTKAHEYLFLLSKRKHYYYDAEATKTQSKVPDDNRGSRSKHIRKPGEYINGIRNDGTYEKANDRSIWETSTEASKYLHFATFPQALVQKCIIAGSSEYGCCTDCGKPYTRSVTSKLIDTLKATKKVVVDQRDHDKTNTSRSKNWTNDGYKPGMIRQTKTTGWSATCNCNAEIQPAIILDPFSGTGTTAIVATKLYRNFIAIEGKAQYNDIAKERYRHENGIFSTLNTL